MKISGRFVNDLSELKQSKQISSSYIVTNYGDSDQEGNEDPDIRVMVPFLQGFFFGQFCKDIGQSCKN